MQMAKMTIELYVTKIKLEKQGDLYRMFFCFSVTLDHICV